MKRSKKLIALVAILVVACIATFALTQYEEKQEEIKNSDAIILEIPTDTVESLSWEYTEDGLGFHKGETGWLYDDDEAFPVSEDKINGILSNFEAFGVSFIIENVEDYSQYGLDDPECTIHLTTAEQTYDVKLGAFSKMDEQRYVDIGDGNVYLVSNDPVDYLETALSSMIEHDDTTGFENVVDITFSGSENYTIVKTEDSPNTYNSDDIYFAQIDGEELPLDTDDITDYLNTIATLDFLDYVTYNATEEELASYGLDDPELTVTVNYTYTGEDDDEVSDTCVIHIGRNVEELAAYEAAKKAEETLPNVTQYVRVGDSQIVYELSDLDYLTLSGTAYDDLRHREVIWADFDTVTQIDITLEGENHALTSILDEEDEDAERVWYYGEEEMDISDLQSALESLSADSFTDETPSEKEEISLTVYLDNENFPQVKIQLYRYDGGQCLAVVDGETVSLVDRSSVMELVEAVQSIVLNKPQSTET